MKLRNLIMIGVMWLMLISTAVSCEEADVGGSNPINNAVNSVVSIGFNINIKSLIDYDGMKAVYPDVTNDWITDASLDIIDSVWVIYHAGTSDDSFKKIAVAPFTVERDNNDGTGSIKAGIANASLTSDTGLTMDVILVKYKDGYDGKEIDKDNVYYLGNIDNYVKIDQKVALGYNHAFDVTIDGVKSNLSMDIPAPDGAN